MYASDSSDSSSCSSCDSPVERVPGDDNYGDAEVGTISMHKTQRPATQAALPPLALKDMNQPLSGLNVTPIGGGSAGRAQGSRQSPRQPAAVADSFNDTKRLLVLRNASVAPSRCAEEEVVVQRFGEHMQRIPTPPVVKEPIHLVNSKEEKHLNNQLRIFGSVDNMNKTYAGGVATMKKFSYKTVRCDAPQSAATAPPTTGVSSSRGSPRKAQVDANQRHVFADLSFIERQQIMQYLEHPQEESKARDTPSQPATPHTDRFYPSHMRAPTGTPHGRPALSSRGGGGDVGGNNFFLVSRALHRERALLSSSMSARGGASSFPAIQSPRTPATAGRTVNTSNSALESAASRGSARRMSSSPRTTNQRLKPDLVAAAQLSEPDEFVLEDTSYVVQATKAFEKGSLAQAKRTWLETQVNNSGNLSAARAESHTSDLLKMIFNARIALECEVAGMLRQQAEDVGVEKLIADAVSTAQRLAMRTANASDFHLFLCNLLRDSDLSFSEARVIFGAIDSNHSGTIDQAELTEGLRLLLLDESQLILTYAKKVFTEVGRHKDTKLSFLEVQAILFATLDFFEVEFDTFDVIDAAHLDPKGAEGYPNDEVFDLQSFPSVNMQQQAKLLNKASSQRAAQPRMTKSNTLQSPRLPSEGARDGDESSSAFGRQDSMLFQAGGASPATKPTTAALPALPMEKPTLAALKKRMVKECSTALREVWKYSQGGQIVVPLLRSLTMQVCPLLHHALINVPVQHFHLKRSGFWKQTLAAEEAKYQQLQEQKSLEADVLRASVGPGSGPPAMGNSVKSVHKEADTLASSTAPVSPRGRNGTFLARKASTVSLKDGGGVGDTDLLAQLATLQEHQPPLARKSSTMGSFGSLRRHSRDLAIHRAQPNLSSLAGLEPISYEEYEEACGDTINVSALQAQLRDGSLRLSQTQRQLIAQQIEQGTAARLAAAAVNARGERKSISGFAGPSASVSGGQKRSNARNGAVKSRTALVDAGSPEGLEGEPRDDAFLQALQRKKSEGGKSMKGASTSDRIDLSEVIDPWHARFQADHDKLSDPARQRAAPEHSQSSYFSKQGHVFTKSPNGVIAPLAENSESASSSRY